MILKKLIKSNLILLPNYKNYQEPQVKPLWYRDEDHCEFHQTKGCKTQSCFKLKHLIQDVIEQGEVNVDKKKQGMKT